MTLKRSDNCSLSAIPRRTFILSTAAALCKADLSGTVTNDRADDTFTRPTIPGDPLIYGVRNGIHIALHPAALDGRPLGGPRGLIRVGYVESGVYRLINYIAVEPVVGGVRGFSELEPSLDGARGKQFWIGDTLTDRGQDKHDAIQGRIETTADGRSLSFVLHIEPFNNGAKPVIQVTLFEQHPERVRFRTYAAKDSSEMSTCTLTATMGNQSRCRQLWLHNRNVFAQDLYPSYTGDGFVERDAHGFEDLFRMPNGDVLAAISPDEFEPREVWPLENDGWHHHGRWMAQYWMKPAGDINMSLRCRVNGRRVYWAGDIPIPGGTAYENFEFRERFHQGQELWFGYTADSPAKRFGFRYDAAPTAYPSRSISAAEKTSLLDAASNLNESAFVNGDFSQGFHGWTNDRNGAEFEILTERDAKILTVSRSPFVPSGNRLYQCFKVPRDAAELAFSIAGGDASRKSYVALWLGNRLYRKMHGRHGIAPFRVRWSLREARGKVVSLEVVQGGDSIAETITVYPFSLIVGD